MRILPHAMDSCYPPGFACSFAGILEKRPNCLEKPLEMGEIFTPVGSETTILINVLNPISGQMLQNARATGTPLRKEKGRAAAGRS